MLIAHVSDPHIRTGPLAGEPAANLHHVLAWIIARQPRPDCVVITGDLCEYGHAGAYPDLRTLTEGFPIPIHLTTGNHDDPEALLATFGGSPFLGGTAATRYRVDYPAASIIVLDSRRSDSPAGLLGDEQLGWLDGMLARRSDVPAFVCLHHPPVPVGIPFLDGMRLDDGAALAEVISRHRHVARVLAGHVHRVIFVPFAGTTVTIAPSTYRQSALRLHDAQPPGYLAEPTGYLLHQLLDGSCITHSMPASHAAGVLGGF
ncbi:phosphodiesterase [Micromonospora craterilacus]|uniref:Phosphodiesterase n=1 Tax=Micromonospora craterilacus TaxID=1655439 RepID=A0A2W2EHQ5_9ACTN|nr:phosphodiesterase [Micromonospora craterilacus]PZG23826.1 phosphodiesterase [Micromonospora craterilacus]